MCRRDQCSNLSLPVYPRKSKRKISFNSISMRPGMILVKLAEEDWLIPFENNKYLIMFFVSLGTDFFFQRIIV